MKLFEEFKLYEELWQEDSQPAENKVLDDTDINANEQLTESLIGDMFTVKLLKILSKLDARQATDMLTDMLNGFNLDHFGELEEPPYCLNKHKIVAMMETDLHKLSTHAWYKKWLKGFLMNGRVELDPADYSDVNLSTLKPGSYSMEEELDSQASLNISLEDLISVLSDMSKEHGEDHKVDVSEINAAVADWKDAKKKSN